MNPQNRPQLVFLISIPRSGSTLLQRILAAHPQVASTGEPWLLLPLANLDRSEGVEAIYDQGNAAKGIQEMIERLPAGRRSYLAHLRQFCLGIFVELAKGRAIFLDKDPRYYLILDFLVELFPEAKFIFLFRNPLDVICSLMSTWLDGRLKLHAYHLDLYEGVRAMSRGCLKYGARSVRVHYEDLVQHPEAELRNICDFLKIDYCQEMLLNFSQVDFGGSMGDPTGRYKYDRVSAGSVSVWPEKLNNWYRIRFARRYLAALGDEVLAPWNFSRPEFEQTVKQLRVRWRGSLEDAVFRHLSDLWRLMSGTHLRGTLRRRRQGEIYLYR